MEYRGSETLLALKDLKNAAIYADYVIPIALTELSKEEAFTYLPTILPPSLRDGRQLGSAMARFIEQTKEAVVPIIYQENDRTILKLRYSPQEFSQIYEALVTDVLNTNKEHVDGVVGQLISATPKENIQTGISVKLSGVKAIDVSQTRWEHILDFRQDVQSVAALKRLRKFIFDDFEGKSDDYIRDTILAKIDEHDRVVKKHGFDLIASSLETILSRDSALVTLASICTSSFIGADWSTAMLTGAAVELGQLSLSIAKHLKTKSEFNLSDPITYLFEAANLPGAEVMKAKRE